MRNFSEKVVEKIKTHFKFNNFFFENHDVYEVMWKRMVLPDRPQMAINRMRSLCLMTKATEHTRRVSNTLKFMGSCIVRIF
jgi:hypothetical protein